MLQHVTSDHIYDAAYLYLFVTHRQNATILLCIIFSDFTWSASGRRQFAYLCPHHNYIQQRALIALAEYPSNET